MNPTPEQFEADPVPLRSNTGANTGMNWAHDVIVLGSIVLSAMALNVMVRTQFSMTPQNAGLLAVGLLTVATALHLVLRRRVEPTVEPTTEARPTTHAEKPKAKTKPEPINRPEHNTKAPARSHPAQHNTPQPPAEPVEDEATRIANLQAMITELARTVPGPRAATPDPDRQAFTQLQAASASSEQELQRAALTSAAQAMRSTLAPERSFASDIADSLAANRVAAYLQPIQALGQQQPQHYELSIRLRDADGREFPHDEVIDEARRHGLLPLLDAALLPRAARIAGHLHNRGRRSDILSTVNAISITDEEFQSGLDVALASAPASTLVLTFSQNDVRHFVPAHWQALATMAHMGCRFAIEDVFDLDLDFETLKAHGFDFVKLDAEVLLAGLPAPSGLIAPDDICRYLTTIGYSIIVGHIDDDMTCARVLGFGALFGQGRLFGGKRAVRADAVNTGAAAA